jgi:hypothetical protein
MAGLNDKNTKLGCLHVISILLGLLITFILGYSWITDGLIPPLFVILATVWLVMMGLSPLMPPKSALLLIPVVFILYAITSIETGVINFRSTHISYQSQPVAFIVHVGLIVIVGIIFIILCLRAKPTTSKTNRIDKDKP